MGRIRVICLTLVLAAGQVALGDILAAANFDEPVTYSQYFTGIGYANPPNFTNEAAAQGFVAGVGGPLTTLSATVVRAQSGGVPLIISVHAAAGILPGALLGQLVVPETEVAGGGVSTFDLSSLGVDLVSGESYVITLRVDVPQQDHSRYAALRINDGHDFGIEPLYSPDGGVTWLDSTYAYEIGLRVSVLPDPATAALMVVAALIRRPRGGPGLRR